MMNIKNIYIQNIIRDLLIEQIEALKDIIYPDKTNIIDRVLLARYLRKCIFQYDVNNDIITYKDMLDINADIFGNEQVKQQLSIISDNLNIEYLEAGNFKRYMLVKIGEFLISKNKGELLK